MGAERYVLDSYAVLVYLQGQPGAELVKHLLHQAQAGEVELWLNQINLGEVYYMLIKNGKAAVAERLKDHLEAFPWDLVGNELEDVLEAATIKAHHPLAYADAFAAQTAERFQAKLVTGDPEFKPLEGRISIQWLPRV